MREIEKLRKELAGAKDEIHAKKKAAYDDTISSLRALEWDEKGLAYGMSGDHSNAVNAFTKAIEFNPKDAGAYYNQVLPMSNSAATDRQLRIMTKL